MIGMMFPKSEPVRSKKLRDSARDRDCTIRLIGHCNRNPATSVLCHLNGGGMAAKKSDIHGAFGCSACHDVVDGRVQSKFYSKEEIELYHRRGNEETQNIWVMEGLLRATA